MFRLLLRGQPASFAASHTTRANPAWNNTLRRLFSSAAETQATIARSRLRAPFRNNATLWQNTHRPSYRTTKQSVFHSAPRRGFGFSAFRRNAKDGAKEESLSLGQRLKKLSREYGWSAVGVYFALSVLDFPFCFLVVRLVGTDTIGRLEHSVVSTAKSLIPESIRTQFVTWWLALKGFETKELGDDEITDKMEMAGWGVREAHKQNQEQASLATQLALAYAIHKSFIFFRVPLTAAVTPRVVKTLRSWGWNIGKKAPR